MQRYTLNLDQDRWAVISDDAPPFRVLDTSTGQLQRARFHRREQAEAWVSDQTFQAAWASAKRVLSSTSDDVRATSYRLRMAGVQVYPARNL